MVITRNFNYHRPTVPEEVDDLVSRYGSEGRILAGGTDLVVLMKDGVEAPKGVIDVKGMDELSRIGYSGGRLHIGAAITFNDLLASDIVREEFPLIWESAGSVASFGIRNRATLVGNICSAVPSLDAGPALLVHEAVVHVRSTGGERRIDIRNWFLGPRETGLREYEYVTGVSLPKSENSAGCYVKLGRYKGEDLAQASVAALVSEGLEYRVAFGAVGPRPIRSAKIEELLNGKEIDDEVIKAASDVIPGEISPITDIRATKRYRTHMTKVMFKRCLKAAVARSEGNGPDYGTGLI